MGLSAATIAVLAAAALVYISGSFVVADALGIKRLLQGVLGAPVVAMACYYVALRPQRLVNPLLGFVVLKTLAEIAFRGSPLDLFDDLATLFGLAVIFAASQRAITRGVHLITTMAGVFALLALVQWVVLFYQPDLQSELLTIDDEGKVVGSIHHVIALLGLATGEEYTFLGHEVTRLQSFAREPSLNLVFFLIPSALAFLRGGTAGKLWGGIMLGFGMLSFSGSVLLSIAFAGAAWLALRVFSVKNVMAWGTLLILGGYMAALASGALNTVVSFISLMSNYGDFLGKEKSFTYRAGGTASTLSGVAGAPLGASALPELPGPWMVNGAMAAGWLGAFMLVLFLRKLAIELDTLNLNRGRQLNVWMGTLILIGAMATVVVFNDYQMSNYPGLVLLGIVYRMIEVQNQLDSEAQGAVAGPMPPPGSRLSAPADDAAQPL